MGDLVVQKRPDGAVTPRVTVPLNPLTEVTVTVELVPCPAFAGAGEEAMMVKSWIRNVAVVEWVREPLVPVTVIV
jgi:hypothetical protein